jgi:diguanylate cyclase (GGDEF)-like protein
LLYGRIEPNLTLSETLHLDGQRLGYLKSREKCEPILQLLHHIIKEESNQKRLAIEILQRYEEINIISDISTQIANCLEIEEIAEIVFQELQKIINFTHICIVLVDWQNQEIQTIYSKQKCLKTKFNTLPNLGIASYVLASGKAEIVNNVLEDERYIKGATQSRALICTPLTVQNETIGVLNISHIDPIYYTTEELQLLATLTSQAAAAIKVAQYYAKLRDYSQSLERKVRERTLELENAKKKLEELATIDKLTRLANRHKFDEYLEYEWQRSQREKLPLSLILCDIDYFKRYNDYYGHPTGDKCLQQVARAIQKVLKRPADLAARYGGEEFAVILGNTPGEGALEVAQQIQTALDKLAIPHPLSSASFYVTLSQGISTVVPSEGFCLEDLVNAADLGLYAAKKRGRNQYYFYAHNRLRSQELA